MIKLLFYTCATALLLVVFPGNSQNYRTTDTRSGNAPIGTGNWIKIAVAQEGIFKISPDFLVKAGINIAEVNPQTLQIFGSGGGMLPQSNAIPRPIGLIENAIFVSGEADGVFNNEDYILFYAQGPDKVALDPETKRFFYEKNIYSDSTYYFLSYGHTSGKRIAMQENEGVDFPVINSFDAFISYEKDLVNILKSGRVWYGEFFNPTLSYNFSFDGKGALTNAPVTIVSSVMGQSYAASSFDISLNGLLVGNQPLNAIPEPDVVRGINLYGNKGADRTDVFTLNAFPAKGDELVVNLKFNKSSTGRSIGYLNSFTLHFQRELALYGEQSIFQSLASLDHLISTFKVKNVGNGVIIWDITEPTSPKVQAATGSSADLLFGVKTDQLKKFIAFNQNFPAPTFVKKVGNQDLMGLSAPHLLIITHPDFLQEAKRLKTFRESHDQLTVEVVTTEQVFNEFSSGAKDITAIRDFAKYLFDQQLGENGLQNLLLFGKTSFDYKNILGNQGNFIPTYESRNSLHPIYSYSSDDYFGFFDEEEGYWSEEGFGIGGDHTMEIGVGRLPVATTAEAKIVVDKLIHYATNERTFGKWRNHVTFVADDGDDNLHQRDAERLGNVLKENAEQFDIRKIYLDAYPQVRLTTIETSPAANQALTEAVDKGTLILNYTGHGSETEWTAEKILDLSTISKWENYNKLPLFVTATCEYGRHDDPTRRSGGEYLVLSNKGGAIGIVTTTRAVFSNTNYALNVAFYNNVFKKSAGKYSNLGEIFRNTKNESLRGSANRNFSLLGDPSMTLAYPEKDIIITSVNDKGVEEETLNALSKIVLEGEIINGFTQSKISTFNGLLSATIFDKEQVKTTLGSGGATPFSYTERANAIFRGDVTVKEGSFSITFIVPKNIDYRLGNGKISMYAKADNPSLDAGGASSSIRIGGSNDSPSVDTTPPVIKMFMENTSFQSGGIVQSSTLLLASIDDESGINISNSGPGQSITAVLDNGESFIVNDYYQTSTDDFTKGWLSFPLKDLEPGKHRLKLKAWDTYNNASEALIEFIVEKDAKLTLFDVINYPNPFQPGREVTTFSWAHNRPGENLEVALYIYSLRGELIHVSSQTIERSEGLITTLTWDGTNGQGAIVDNGIYIYKIGVKSLDSGLNSQHYQKLIINN